MRRGGIGVSLIGLLAVLVVGCAVFQTTPRDPFGSDGNVYRADRVTIQVLSQFNEDVIVHALTNAGARRLGEVARKAHAVFQLGMSRGAELRVRVEVLAGPRYTTNALSVQPGDRVELWIPTDVSRSFIRRR